MNLPTPKMVNDYDIAYILVLLTCSRVPSTDYTECQFLAGRLNWLPPPPAPQASVPPPPPRIQWGVHTFACGEGVGANSDEETGDYSLYTNPFSLVPPFQGCE
jgi:hypothetical protein